MKSDNHWTGRGVIKSKKTIDINDPHKGPYEVTDLVLEIERIIKGVAKYTVVPLEAWGEVSKLTNDILEGDVVVVEGHFANKKWQNKKQEPMTKNVVVVEKITLAPNEQ